MNFWILSPLAPCSWAPLFRGMRVVKSFVRRRMRNLVCKMALGEKLPPRRRARDSMLRLPNARGAAYPLDHCARLYTYCSHHLQM